MERIEGIPPPPSSFTGPAATGYNYQSQNSANKFAKRKQSVTGQFVFLYFPLISFSLSTLLSPLASLLRFLLLSSFSSSSSSSRSFQRIFISTSVIASSLDAHSSEPMNKILAPLSANTVISLNQWLTSHIIFYVIYSPQLTLSLPLSLSLLPSSSSSSSSS